MHAKDDMATLVADKSGFATTLSRQTPLWKTVNAWLAILPFIIFSGGGWFSFQVTAGSGSLAGLNASASHGFVDRYLLPGVAYMAVVWFVLRHIKAIVVRAGEMKLFLIIPLLAILSSLWSQDPLRSLTYGSFYLLETLFAFALASRFTTEEVMDLLKMTGTSIALAGLATVVLFPRYGITHDVRGFSGWRGVIPERTSEAQAIFFLLTPALYFSRQRLSWYRIFYVGLLLLMLVAARSATSLIILALYVATMAVIYVSGRLASKAVLFLYACAVLGVGLVLVLLLTNLNDFVSVFGRDLTLTGRTDIWSALLPSIGKHPLLGYGFYSFWLGLKGESANLIIRLHWVFGYAHNGFLEIVLQLGLIGLALVLTTLGQALFRAGKLVGRHSTVAENWCFGFMVVSVFYNIDESTLMWPHSFMSILYILVCCKITQAYRARSTRMQAQTAHPIWSAR